MLSDNGVDDWYLVKQPVFRITELSDTNLDKQIMFYELLLRSKTTHKFPAQAFKQQISTKQGNQVFFVWLAKKIIKFFQYEKATKISINLDEKQIIGNEFLIFLRMIEPYKNHILFELTERMMIKMTKEKFYEYILYLDNNGFKILLDDVDKIKNYTYILDDLVSHVFAIKLSSEVIKKNIYEHDTEFTNFLRHINKEKIIGEGTSSLAICLDYLKYGIFQQQGWLLGTEKLLMD